MSKMVKRKEKTAKETSSKKINKTPNASLKPEDEAIVNSFIEKSEVKEESKNNKDSGQQLVDKASVEQCVCDIKTQGVVAIQALKKYFHDKGGKSLFPEMDYALSATVVYKKPALITKQLQANILLPHPVKSFENSTVCLILPDLDQSEKARKDPDIDKQARQWAEKIEKEHDFKNRRIKIMTKRQMEREFRTFYQKRAFATQYDLFLVDSRVTKAVRTFLGKEFIKAHKRPLQFDYSKPLAESISRGLSTVMFPVNRYMTRSSVSVGHLVQETSDLSENLNSVIDKVAEICPGGLLNIRSIYLQPCGSQPTIPIFRDDGDHNDIEMETEEKRSRPDQKVVVDECNTLPDGLKIEVRRNGRIRVLRESDNKGVLYPTVNDEWDQRDINKPIIDPAKLENKKKIKAKRNAKRASVAVQHGGKKKLKLI